MIAYFDTSALIPLLVDEPASDAAERLWYRASWVASVRISYAEARAGLARAHRMGRISSGDLRVAVAGLESIDRHLYQVEVTESLVRRAGDLAEASALRGYDAVHLAASASLDVRELVLVTGDRQLGSAAEALGLVTALIGEAGSAGSL